MIRVRGMHKSYRTGRQATEVLRGVDLDISTGELVSLLGPSGSGKSTLLHAIGGLDREYTGNIEVDGRDLHRLDDATLSDYRNRSVGFVFQSFYLLPHLSCLENVALPAVFARLRPDEAPLGEARAAEVLAEVGLEDKVHALPTTLSGGQRQRVAIARALFHRPRLLLCDEPTGNLDRKMGDAILELFVRLHREQSLTVLIVTHDPHIADATHRRLMVEDGRVIEERAEATT